MSTTNIDIRFEGDNFYPSHLKHATNWPLEILVETGEISPRGKYKGKASPYGLALYRINDKFLTGKNIIQVLEEYTSRLIKFKSAIQSSGVKEIIFDIETKNSKDYNFFLDSITMGKLSELNATVEFHGNEEELAFDKWIANLFEELNSNKFFTKEEINRLISIKNQITHSSKHIQFYNYSRIYDFLLLYVSKYMSDKNNKIPPFEEAYEEYKTSI